MRRGEREIRGWASTGTHFYTCVRFVEEQNMLTNGTLRISLNIVYQTGGRLSV